MPFPDDAEYVNTVLDAWAMGSFVFFKRRTLLVHDLQCRHKSPDRQYFFAASATSDSFKHENDPPSWCFLSTCAYAHPSSGIKLLQHLLNLIVLLLHRCQCFFNSRQTFLFVRFISRASFVFLLSIVLNLLTAILDLCQSQCCRGSLQEMTEGGKCCQIALLSAHC